MRFFTKTELLVVIFILTVLGVVVAANMQVALRRARDAQRRDDLNTIANALIKYRDDFGFIPPADDGMIKGCKAPNFEEKIKELETKVRYSRDEYFEAFRGCLWGEDSLTDVFDENFSPYLLRIPQDPRDPEGQNYLYLSDQNFFQIYGFLEGGEDEIGYSEGIVRRNLMCGVKICNTGRGSPDIPLDKLLEDYVRELEEKRKQN